MKITKHVRLSDGLITRCTQNDYVLLCQSISKYKLVQIHYLDVLYRLITGVASVIEMSHVVPVNCGCHFVGDNLVIMIVVHPATLP